MHDDDPLTAAARAGPPYRSTLDSLLEGFQIIARDWTYLYVNPAAARHGRRTPEELHGRKMWEVYPGVQDTPLFAVLTRCMNDRKAVSLENLFTFPDNSTRWFEIRVEPVPEGLCVHSIDIQHRKSAEAAMRQLNADLEHRVEARTRELKEMNEELEAFSYSVSHDLRAPLRHVRGFTGLLSERAGSALDEQSQRYLQRITDAARRMENLIDDLLTFSRIGRAPIQKRPVPLGDIVREAQKEILEERAETEVVWTVGQLPAVEADSGLLHVVFVNLLSNAVKFTRGRTPARIDVTATRDDGRGEVVVAVRDNGAGFDMRYVGKLFGVFQRLHSDTEFEGTGIGLANVRRIIARHGGRTWAEGAVDEGATFYFSLPIRARDN